jgi:hypothetical protein
MTWSLLQTIGGNDEPNGTFQGVNKGTVKYNEAIPFGGKTYLIPCQFHLYICYSLKYE